MRPRLWTSAILFISAYSPLFLMIMVKDYDFDKTHQFKHLPYILTSIILIILSISFLFVIIKTIKHDNKYVTVISSNNRTVDIVGYSIPYMVSFFGINLDSWSDIISLNLFLLVLFVLTVKSQSDFLNPLLAIAGYGLYNVEYDYNNTTHSSVIISKFNLKKDDRVCVTSISPYLDFIIRKED